MSDTSSDAVREWYSKPEHFFNTDPGSKIVDWDILGALGYDLMFESKRVVNLGPCGIDEVMFAHRTHHWYGVDFTWKQADFRVLPFDDNSIDTVIDFSSTDHIEFDRDKARREVFRILKPMRYYVLTYPNACFIGDHERETREYGYERRWTPQEMIAELTSFGFTIAQHRFRDARSALIAVKPEGAA
jgi:SAM-dependent methyltransferase